MLGSFHGRTLAGIAATGQEKVKKGFEPPVQGFCPRAFQRRPRAARRGAGPGHRRRAARADPGRERHPPGDARSFCSSRAICATGTGCCSCSTKCSAASGAPAIGAAGRRSLGDDDLMPDAVSWAKGIAGGFPLGAIWVSDRPVTLKTGETKPLCDLLGPGSHGTTFGGTPLVSAGANEVLAVIEEEGMLENARDRRRARDSRDRGDRLAAHRGSARRRPAARLRARRGFCRARARRGAARAEPVRRRSRCTKPACSPCRAARTPSAGCRRSM